MDTDEPTDAPLPTMAERKPDLMARMVEETRQKAKCGRKTKRSPELIDEIVLLLRAGITLEVACDSCGVRSDTVYNWRKADPELDKTIVEAMSVGMEAWEATMLSVQSGGTHSTGDRQRDRDLVKLMMWIMGKRNPLYREKVEAVIDTTRYTFVSSDRVSRMLSAPPEIIDGEFVEVEALEDGRDDTE